MTKDRAYFRFNIAKKKKKRKKTEKGFQYLFMNVTLVLQFLC